MSIHARLLSTLLIVAAATGCDDPQENPDVVAACTSKLTSAGDRLGEGGAMPRFPWVSADNAGPWNPNEDYGLGATDPCRQLDVPGLRSEGDRFPLLGSTDPTRIRPNSVGSGGNPAGNQVNQVGISLTSG